MKNPSELLEEMSALCEENGFQLVAVILDSTPNEDTVTPINAWHPSWVKEFKLKCQSCRQNAIAMTIQLGNYVEEIALGIGNYGKN